MEADSPSETKGLFNMQDTLNTPRTRDSSTLVRDELAILGGPIAIDHNPGDLITWPMVTEEDEVAVLEVLRRGGMSGTEITRQFEEEFAAWQGTRYALGFSSGTASIHTAMFACGVGVGDEIICPSITYWASALQCFSLGATVVFAEVDINTLCIDPNDIEHRISPRTKAIVVVHYAGHPCDMDPIVEIARRHNIKVIEDVSHAQGGFYKGRKVGTLGDVGAMSLMSGKSFAIGEAGILVTDDREIWERAMAFGHYERFTGDFETEALRPFAGLPLGGYKYRMHQLSSAMGRVQLKYYDERCEEIDKAMTYFGELIEDIPGLRIRKVEEVGSTMAGWYHPMAHYSAEELGGLSVGRFAAAARAEGLDCIAGCNFPLHLHPVFNECDVYGDGRPTRIAHSAGDVRQKQGSLPISESINSRVCTIPYFKHYRPAAIEEYAAAYRKVALNYESLLEGDTEVDEGLGSLSFTTKKSV
jgi:perosamine synthetase